MGVKYLDYLDFKTVYELIKQNAHLTESGKFIIRNLKNQMNRARTQYIWGHLSDLYT